MRKKRLYKMTGGVACAVAAATAAAMLAPGSAMAYNRYEHATVSGGTQVTVCSGSVNSNDQDPYLEKPGDYLAASSFTTERRVVSDSNITSSTNYTSADRGAQRLTRGGVKGVSWDASSKTLTLDSAKGTVIAIAGPELDVFSLNTYNDKLSPMVDCSNGGLTYFRQDDNFVFPNADPNKPDGIHSKTNRAEQENITIKLVGKSTFAKLTASGNVGVKFSGSGTLELDAGKTWNYDDYSDPSFSKLLYPSSQALASYPTIGTKGEIQGSVSDKSTFPNGMSREITETFEYAQPEFSLGKGVQIAKGGKLHNSAKATAVEYFSYEGTGSPTSGEAEASAPEGVENTYTIKYDGSKYSMVYNDAKTKFYAVETTGMGPNEKTNYYDISKNVKEYAPYESFVGSDEGEPAQSVMLKGTAKGKAADSAKVNAGTVTASKVKKAIGANAKSVKTVVIGANVKKIAKGAFKAYGKVRTLRVESKKLTKKSVKKSLVGSKVRTVKVAVSKSKSVNRNYVVKYKAAFAKGNSGKSVKVKIG